MATKTLPGYSGSEFLINYFKEKYPHSQFYEKSQLRIDGIKTTLIMKKRFFLKDKSIAMIFPTISFYEGKNMAEYKSILVRADMPQEDLEKLCE